MNNLVLKNIFWLTVSRILALVLLLFAYRSLFPYLGPYKSGQYNFILSYVLIFSTIVDFGIAQLVTKQISEDPVNIKKYFSNFFAFEFWLSFFIYFALVLIAMLNGYKTEVFYGICVCGLGMVINALTYPFLAVLSASQDLKKVAWINFLNSLINITIIFIVVFYKKDIVFLSTVQLVFGLTSFVIYRFLVRKYISEISILKALFKIDTSLIKNILKSGWPFALLVGFSAIYNRIDAVIIVHLKGYEQAGFYSTAYKIFDLIGFFPSIVSFSLFPFFTKLMTGNLLNQVKENVEKYIKLMIVFAVPMAFGGMVLARDLVSLVTDADPRFLPAVPVLQVLIWAPAILCIYIPLNSLVISQLTKKAAVVTGVNVLINIIGNLLFVPRFGIQAAAYMTVFSELVQAIFYFYFVNKNIVSINIKNFFFKPIAASFVMALCLKYFDYFPLFVSIALGGSVYFLLLFVFGYLGSEEWKSLKLLAQNK